MYTANRMRLVSLGILVGGIVFVAHAGFILSYFYRVGGQYLDAGLFAWLIGRASFALPIPIPLGGGSFYAIHVSPLFSLTSILFRRCPWSVDEDFAIFTGIMGALPAVAVYWMLVGPLAWRRGWAPVVAAVLAIGFGFNGFVLAALRYPHIEPMIPGALMLFLVALLERRRWLAIGFFVLALATREDAGFHAALILGCLAILQARASVSSGSVGAWRVTLGFMAVGLLYSSACLVLQHRLFPGQSLFLHVYIGSPPFSRLSFSSVVMRLLGCCLYRSYLVFPTVVTLLWAVRRRDLDVVLGFILCLPWFLLNLLAVSEIAGTLSGYYGFPILLAMFWPLVAMWLARQEKLDASATTAHCRETLIGFGTILLSSWIIIGAPYNPSRLDLVDMFFSAPPGRADRARIEAGIVTLRQLTPYLGNVGADAAVLSLAPDGFGSTVSFDHQPLPPGPLAAIYYFAGSSQAAFMVSLAAARHLDRHYAVGETPLRIATDHDLSQFQIPDIMSLPRP